MGSMQKGGLRKKMATQAAPDLKESRLAILQLPQLWGPTGLLSPFNSISFFLLRELIECPGRCRRLNIIAKKTLIVRNDNGAEKARSAFLRRNTHLRGPLTLVSEHVGQPSGTCEPPASPRNQR